MILSADKLTGFDLKILPGFKPVTKLALSWKQLANGGYFPVDRGTDCDIYESEITACGREDVIDSLIRVLDLNRYTGSDNSNKFNLSGFNGAEKIFGAEIDYTQGVTAAVMKYGKKTQKSWKGFSIKLTLRACGINPYEPEEAPADFPAINDFCENPQARASLGVGFTADSNVDIDKMDAYTGIKSFIDNRSDAGFFEGVFTLKTEYMAELRRFLIRDNRGRLISSGSREGQIINGIPGVRNIFGVRRSGVWPFNVRITEFTDMGMKKLDWWQIKLKIAEEI
ncbi:MAG: hypothetical protein LBB56_05175 [Chitinispirillales bacterium]|jgi:hypothetical protein|nr:hypothetical protein [Chitinispirillales bacterium]